ncbi:MAG: activator-dependent family glycosyltransferase [Kibdelosporangium sp.]
MRVLFVANPEKAHFYAMVPLAWALRTAGHEVRFASQPRFADTITQAGLTAVPVGRDVDLWDLIPRHDDFRDWTWEPKYGLQEHPPYDVAESPEKATWAHMAQSYGNTLLVWHKQACFPMIGGVAEFARNWQPDLVLWEPLAFAGPIAAKACGAAHARLMWSVDVFGYTRGEFLRLKRGQPADDRKDWLAEWLDGYARKYGTEFTEDMITGQFTVDQLPASLRLEGAGLHYLPMRYVPYGGAAVIPKWLHARPRRPRVALSMGVSLTDHGAGFSVSVQAILDQLSTMDIEVVATIPESEQRKLTRVPDNARLVSYAPLDALAATCSAIITHGGYGTFLTSALHGVPQLSAAWDFDSPLLAGRGAAQGGSLMIRADQATGEVVRDNVARLLTEPAFGERANALRDELFALPTPNELVGDLEELTTKHRTR